MTLTKHEAMLAACLLDLAGERFSNDGCCDFDISDATGMTQDECTDFDRSVALDNGDVGEHHPSEAGQHHNQANWVVMYYIATRIREEFGIKACAGCGCHCTQCVDDDG